MSAGEQVRPWPGRAAREARTRIGAAVRDVGFRLCAVGLLALVALTRPDVLNEIPIPPTVTVWVGAGALGAWLLDGLGDLVNAWIEARQVRRCPVCRNAFVALADADRRWTACAGGRHAVEHFTPTSTSTSREGDPR